VTVVGIRLRADSDCKEQRAATVGYRTVSVLGLDV
jgi:hypothetical protein